MEPQTVPAILSAHSPAVGDRIARLGHKERDRLNRKDTYRAAKMGYWVPAAMSLADYRNAVKAHPPIPEMLTYLSENHRDWGDEGEEFRFNQSNGFCEKCSTRALNLPPITELKASGNSGFDGEEIQYSKFVAERFALKREPVTLTQNLHREFVYQSWVEALHLDHIRAHVDEPGIAAVEAHPTIEDGVMHLVLSFRAIDGSHRAALAYKEGRPFRVHVLTPVEALMSVFAIGTKKNPFFVLGYSPEAEGLLKQCGLPK
jgi:hypothetical protein